MTDPTRAQTDSLLRDFTLARALSENAHSLALLITPDGVIVDLNQHMADSLGQPIEKLKGTLLWPHLPPESRALHQATVQRVAEARQPDRHDTRYNGRWYDSSLTPCLNKEGMVIGVAVVAWDITDRKQREEALQEGEARFRTILDASPVPIAVNDENQNITFLNRRFIETFGYTLADIPTVTAWWPRAYPDPAYRQRIVEEWQVAIEKAQRDGTDVDLKDYKVTCKDGSVRDIHFSATAIAASHLVILHDITERKRAEDGLRHHQVMLSRTESIAQVGSWEWDVATDTVTWSDELFRIFQRSPSEGAPSFAEHSPHFNPGDMQRLKVAVEAAISKGTPYEMELRVIRKDGETRVCLARGHAETGTGQSASRLFGSLQDITERRQMEERLLQSQKLEGIGHLAGGMAHEFNNILAGMLMNLSLVKMSKLGAESRDLVHEMEALARRAAALIKQLLAFSRQSVLQPKPMDLAAAISVQCNALKPLLGERISLEFSSRDALPWVNADKAMIEQVVLNLCLNARDAMKAGGQLRLSLSAVDVDDEEAKAHERAHPGRYVCQECPAWLQR